MFVKKNYEKRKNSYYYYSLPDKENELSDQCDQIITIKSNHDKFVDIFLLVRKNTRNFLLIFV